MSDSTDPALRLRIWQGGQFTMTLAAVAAERYTLIAGDGRGAVRTVQVDGAAWQETAATMAARAGGMAVRRLHVGVDRAGAVRRTEWTGYPSGATTTVETLLDDASTTWRSVTTRPDGSVTEQLTDAAGTTIRVDDGAG